MCSCLCNFFGTNLTRQVFSVAISHWSLIYFIFVVACSPHTYTLVALVVSLGQMVSSEILMASEPGCPIEMHHIKIAKCDEMYDRDCRGGRTMPFHRAIYDSRTGQSPNNPREQVGFEVFPFFFVLFPITLWPVK